MSFGCIANIPLSSLLTIDEVITALSQVLRIDKRRFSSLTTYEELK